MLVPLRLSNLNSAMADVRQPAATPVVWLRSLVFAAVFYLTTALFLLLGSWLLFAPRRWAMAGLALHARTSLLLLRWICGTRIEVRGRSNIPPGPSLIVAKHQSTWETFALIPVFKDPAVVLKDELKWIPFYGWFCIKFRHIRVKREKATAALKSLIADAKDRAAAGREIIIFPEGTRRTPGAPPDYRPGYVALYEALGIPAVPLALNSGLFWPRRSLLRFPGTIVIECLPAISPGRPRAEFRREIENAIEAASNRLIAEAANRPDPPPAARAAVAQT